MTHPQQAGHSCIIWSCSAEPSSKLPSSNSKWDMLLAAVGAPDRSSRYTFTCSTENEIVGEVASATAHVSPGGHFLRDRQTHKNRYLCTVLCGLWKKRRKPEV